MVRNDCLADSGGILDGTRRFEVSSATISEEYEFDESSNSCRRLRYTANGRNRDSSKADDRDRRKPIIWHIMKIYSAHGINEFVICLGTRATC